MTNLVQGTLHFGKVNEPIKKDTLLNVPFSKLKVLKNFNDREDYGDVLELAESIYQVGPKVPLKGYKEGEKYVVIVGHRRYRAAEMIKKKYGKNVIFQMVLYPKGANKVDMLIDTLLTNSGKDLTPLEKAAVVSKLIAEKIATKDIAGALGGVSEVYVKNLAKLWEVPEAAKKLIRDGTVSATTVIAYLKTKNANWEEFIAEVIKLAEGKKKGKKKAKVSAKDRKKSSLQEFRRYRINNGLIVPGKKEFFDFMASCQDNKLEYNDILNFFNKE